MAPPPCAAQHPTVAPPPPDDDGVSAVIGTILILAITVVGIAGVLFYGAPTIDRIQSRNAQAAIEGSFQTLRDSAQELSVPDHARYPSINLPSGKLSLETGDRFLIAANHDSDHVNCDLHITDWSDADDDVTVSATGCRVPTTTCVTPMAAAAACLEVYVVAGGTITRQTAGLSGSVASVAGADFSSGDWAFRLTDGTTDPAVYAEAWLHSTDMVVWGLESSTGSWKEYYDAGAIFSQTSGRYFLAKEAPIGDTSFGVGYYGFWLRTLVVTNGNYAAVTGTTTHSIQLSLLGVSTRVDDDATYLIRFDVQGPLAEPWCNSILARNIRLGADAIYTEDPDLTCAAGNGDGQRSLTYTCLTCPGTGSPFKFRFLHARIATSFAAA